MTASRLAIGVDLGGTRLRAALVAEDGSILRRTETATLSASGADAVLEQIETLARQVARAAGARPVCGLGLCAPGPLDTEAGKALSTPTIAGFTDLPLRTLLAGRVPWPVLLENDAIAATYGEWRFGAGRGSNNLVYVTISTGIGGGAVVDGRLLHGRKGMATHFGHMIIDPDGPVCSCGNRGCWEAFASGSALDRQARKSGYDNAENLFAAARTGDSTAIEIISTAANLLGVGLVNLLHLYSPEIMILGGGLAHGFDRLAGGIQDCIESTAMPPFRDVPVVAAGLAGNSGLIGIAAMVFDRQGNVS